MLGLFAAPFAQEIFDQFPKNLLGIMVIAAGLELVGVGESLNTAGAIDPRQDRESGVNVERSTEQQSDKAMRDVTAVERKRRWTIMTMTIGGILAFHNDAIGFIAGMLCHWSFTLQDQWTANLARREGQIRLGDNEPN